MRWELLGPGGHTVALVSRDEARRHDELRRVRAEAEFAIARLDHAVSRHSRSRCSFCGDLTGRLGPSGHRCAGCDALVAQAEAENRRERALAPRNGYLARADCADLPIEYRTYPNACVLSVR